MALPELAPKYPLKPRKTTIFFRILLQIYYIFEFRYEFYYIEKQSRRRQLPPLPGLLFVCLPFCPKPVFSADEHYCGAGSYQGQQVIVDFIKHLIPTEKSVGIFVYMLQIYLRIAIMKLRGEIK